MMHAKNQPLTDPEVHTQTQVRTASDGALLSALVDLRDGSLLSASGEDPHCFLDDLAATAPEFFATDRVSWEVIFGRLQAQAEARGFQDVVLVSERHVYVLLRSARDRALALVGLAARTQNVGLIFSEARARLRLAEDGF